MDNTELSDLPFCVEFRLRAYKLYGQSSVIWTHPTLASTGIICQQPDDLNNSRTYTFPDPKTGKILFGSDICEMFEGGPDWGSMHCIFEELSEEWTCEALKSESTEESMPEKIKIEI